MAEDKSVLDPDEELEGAEESQVKPAVSGNGSEGDTLERALRGVGRIDDEMAEAGKAEARPTGGAEDDKAPVGEPAGEGAEDAAADEGQVEAQGPDDVPEGEEAAPSTDVRARAGDAARIAQQAMQSGLEAFRSVREATQLHSSARDELKLLREQLDLNSEELRHRIDIEQRYPQIVAEQTAELDAATTAAKELLARAEGLEAEREDIESQLSIMKNRHEDELRPYRNVSESTKGRADDAARALADARRAVKSAESNLAEATKRRDQRLSAANRAVDNAQDRLRKVEAELTSMQQEEGASSAALSRLRNELVSEQNHLDSARKDVPVVTEEARQAVETAQVRLFDQKQLLAQTERDADAAKQEAAARRTEYDELLKAAQDEERELSDQIKLRTTAAEKARREHGDAYARITAAQEALDEAESIHATPQETISLRDEVSRIQADLDRQQDEVDELAANERELRKGTFRQRLVLVLAFIAALVIIIAIIVAIATAR